MVRRNWKAPGKNEGFVDYMLRRASNGTYDKRDDQQYSQPEEDDNQSPDNGPSSSQKNKKTSLITFY